MKNSIFVNPKSKKYISENKLIAEGEIIDLFYSEELSKITKEQKEYYDQNAQIYDDVSHLSFDIQNEDEDKVRNDFIQWLDISQNHTILDLSCGTGKDSVKIAERLTNGSLYCADISKEMLKKCKEKVDNFNIKSYYCVANAEYLPFADNSFDRLISFGGLNVFGDIKKSTI